MGKTGKEWFIGCRSRREGNGVGRSAEEQNGMGRSVKEWNGVERNAMKIKLFY